MMSELTEEAVVLSVGHGDLLICQYVDSGRVEAIHVKYVEAPRRGRGTGLSNTADRGAFDAWLWLHNVCNKKTVYVSQRTTGMASWVTPFYGSVPITWARVRIKDSEGILRNLSTMIVMAGYATVKAVRVPEREMEYVERLAGYEAEARRCKIGQWSETASSGPFYRKIDDQQLNRMCTGAPLEVIVMGCRTGSLEVCLVEQQLSIQFSWVGVKLVNPEEFSHWVSENIWSRKMEIQLCQRVGYGKLIGYTVGDDDPVVDMIREGIVTLDIETAFMTPRMDVYMREEMQARWDRVGCWEDTEFGVVKFEDFDGVCTHVRGSSAIAVRTESGTRNIVLQYVVAPFYGGFVWNAEPGGFDAYEYLWNVCRGQKVRIVSGYRCGEYEEATCWVGKVCVNDELVKRGIARLAKPVIGPLPSSWYKLNALETSVKPKGIGMRRKEVPFRLGLDVVDDSRIYEFSGTYEAIEGTIECIRCGKFVIFSKKANVWFFVYGKELWRSVDLITPAEKDVFYEEYITFAFNRYVQCHVTAEYSQFTSLYSNMRVTLLDGTVVDLEYDLVAHGMARLCKTASAHPEHMQRAQQNARKAHIGQWRLESGLWRRLEVGHSEKIKVLQVVACDCFHVQMMNDDMTMISETLRNFVPPDECDHWYDPMLRECVIFRRDIGNGDQYARAHVCVCRRGKTVTLRMIDEIEEDLQVSCADIYKAPRKMCEMLPQAMTVSLASCKPVDDDDNHFDEIEQLVFDRVLFMHLVYWSDSSRVLITDGRYASTPSLNALLIRNGILQYDYHDVPEPFIGIMKGMDPGAQKRDSEEERWDQDSDRNGACEEEEEEEERGENDDGFDQRDDAE